jgi:DnaJ-class molecular chaperone
MRIIEEVSQIMARHGRRCTECNGSGRVPIPEYVKRAIGFKADVWMCNECFGTGETDLAKKEAANAKSR